MQLRIALAVIIAVIPTVEAQPRNAPDGDGRLTERQVVLERLLSEHKSPEALADAVQAAREAGVGDQAILEARFLYHVDRGDDAAVAALLPEFIARRDKFDDGGSAIFATEDDWLATVEYVGAIAALEAGDKPAFKKHITEAFWLSPRQSAAYTQQVERFRTHEAMQSVRIDPKRMYASVLQGGKVRLKSELDAEKPLLLHFWSPMSEECIAAMKDFVATARLLEANNFVVVSLMCDAGASARDEAMEVLRSYDRLPGSWLVDAGQDALASKLRVRDLPVFVLVSSGGKVSFNGAPTDRLFWQELEKIKPGIERPRVEE